MRAKPNQDISTKLERIYLWLDIFEDTIIYEKDWRPSLDEWRLSLEDCEELNLHEWEMKFSNKKIEETNLDEWKSSLEVYED